MEAEATNEEADSRAEARPVPRSRRVGLAGPPAEFRLSSLLLDDSPPVSPTSQSPPIPARSPRRPPPPTRSFGSSLSPSPSSPGGFPSEIIGPRTRESLPAIVGLDVTTSGYDMPLEYAVRNSSFPSLRHLVERTPSSDGGKSARESFRAASPLIQSPLDDSASSSSSLGQPISMSKRQHALHELLASERAYASDLAVIREVYMPLASGRPAIGLPTPPSSRVSSASESSTASASGAPMTTEDIRIIFNNIAELAAFADSFSDRLQEALGSIVDGRDESDDFVGALFLRTISDMERLYKFYISRQGSSDEHLQGLPKTPALDAYYAQTRSIASSISHAWDLHSLLIKPVQRLLKYPLLLAAILDETPRNHPDYDKLKQAKTRIEEVARNVNEERRRAEVVKGILSAKKSKSSNLTVTAQVNLSRIKSSKKTSMGLEGSEESARVEKMRDELQQVDGFAQDLARHIIDWAKGATAIVNALRGWALNFGRVIGLSEDQESEAFNAFLTLITDHLVPLCIALESAVNDLLKEMAHLLKTTTKPTKLLSSMAEQEPYHHHLLTMNVSQKNRPPPALLEASKNYLALRGQLASELPAYLQLLHKGFSVLVRKLADIQTEFWGSVRDQWKELWEMLRVEGEMNAGHEETIAVWHSRFVDVDEVVAELNIVKAKKLYQEPRLSRKMSIKSATASLATSSGRSKVTDMLSSLEPVQVSSPYPLSPTSPASSRKTRMSDASSKSRIWKRPSNESMKSTKRPSSSKGKGRVTEDFGEYVAVMSASPSDDIVIPRTKSMPLGGRANDFPVDPSLLPVPVPPRSPNMRRKSTDAASGRRSSSSRHRSTPNPKGISASSSQSSYTGTHAESFATYETRRSDWQAARAKYMCQAIYPCQPPPGISYFSFPFFTLNKGDIYEVLQEAGHPSLHPKLPLYVDEGEDCLLLCRDDSNAVGWALASFLEPLGTG